MTKGYCVRCRKMVDMINVKEIRFKNGRKADQGKCKHCGTTVTRIK